MRGLCGWVVALTTFDAGACLRDVLDEKTVQWSSLIVEGRLVDVSERVELKALSVKPAKGSKGPEVSAVYWYRLYSFEVVTPLDGSAKAKHRVEAIRFFGRVAEGSAGVELAGGARPTVGPVVAAPQGKVGCGVTLTKGAVGKVFYLFLRPEVDLKLEKPPVWADPKADLREKEIHDVKGQAVIHLIPAEKVGAGELSAMKKLIAETRSAEKKVADADLKKLMQTLMNGSDGVAIEEVKASIRKIGWRAMGALKSSRDKGEATAEGMERVLGLIEELSPPRMALEMGLVVE